VGSSVFAAIALVASLFFTIYAGARTRDPSQKGSNQCMACGLTWLALFYMWIGWSTFYQAQVYPYTCITPTVESGTG